MHSPDHVARYKGIYGVRAPVRRMFLSLFGELKFPRNVPADREVSRVGVNRADIIFVRPVCFIVIMVINL